METEQIIAVKNLSKRFGAFEAVKDVSFTVNKGDVFGFLGPNGAGKSTTMRCILSLITPDAGDIKLFGKSMKMHRNEILGNIGCIIEKPDFYKYLSAERNLELFARISGTNATKKDIQEILDFVGLGTRGKHKVKGFSHGMKQRLGIAQALIHKPDLIVLDEPTTGLDPQGIIEVRKLILRLKEEQNKTIILSSHQLAEIELIANRMVIINQGKTSIEGDVQALLNAEELVVRIETTSPTQALLCCQTHFPASSPTCVATNVIEVELKKDEIPKLSKVLVQHDIPLIALEPKRKLEDFFIKTVMA